MKSRKVRSSNGGLRSRKSLKNDVPAPGCWDVSPVPAGFWGNLEKSQALWQDCLAGRTPAEPIAKLAAMSRLLGLGRGPEGLFRIANTAWMNGAHLAATGIPLEALISLTGDHEPAARSLLSQVWQIRGVAGTEQCALLDQRRLLQRALGKDPLHLFLCPLNLWSVAAIAGWLAYDAQHLVTARAVTAEKLTASEQLLITQLARELNGWEPQASLEALARLIAGTYAASEPQESLEIACAVEASLAEARKRQWGPCDFLRDAIKRGRALALHCQERALALLDEVGAGVQRMEATFEKTTGRPVGKASDAQAWEALQDWLPRTHPESVAGANLENGLRVLRHAYDFLFWFGLLRQLNRRGKSARLIERARRSHKVQSAPPDWAAAFIGREFDPAAARAAGWIDQGSANAHFGVEAAPGLWLFKIDDMGQGCCCGHVWWRFLFAQLGPDGRIARIRTQVDEVFADGHGELVTDELLPIDIERGIEALQNATGGVPAGR